MAFKFADSVRETSTTTGTGTLNLAGAVSGYQTFVAGIGSTNTCVFTIEDANGTAWEHSYGTVTDATPDTLSRTLIASSTGSLINLSAGTHTVYCAWIGDRANAAHFASQNVTPGGRLTLESGVPISVTDQTAKTDLLYTPFTSNVISLWDGNFWRPIEFTEYTLALGTKTAFVPYDIYAYLNAGALALEATAWLNATVTITIASPGVVTWTAHGMANGDPVVFTTSGALPTGLSANTQYWLLNKATDTFQVSATPGGAAINTTGTQSGTHTGWQAYTRATAVTLQDGRYCKSGDKTRLLLGTIVTTATTTTEDSDARRLVGNVYNTEPRRVFYASGAASHAYSSSTIRHWNNTIVSSVQMCLPLGQAVTVFGASNCAASDATTSGFYGVTPDALSPQAYFEHGYAGSTLTVRLPFGGVWLFAAGYRRMYACERRVIGAGSVTGDYLELDGMVLL